MAKETKEVARLDVPTTETAASTASPAAIAETDSRLHAEIVAARGYRAQAKAANTLRAYASDWNQFEGWCDGRSLEPLPARPEAVATYLASLALAGKAGTTIGRHLGPVGPKLRFWPC